MTGSVLAEGVHEALLRLQAAEDLLQYADAGRVASKDAEAGALDLVRAANRWLAKVEA